MEGLTPLFNIEQRVTYSANMSYLKEIEAILFDIDDTLLDRKTAVKNALRLLKQELPDLFKHIPEDRIFAAFDQADGRARDDFDSGKPGTVVRDNRSRTFLRLLGLPELYSKKVTAHYIGAFPAVSVEVPGAHTVVEGLARTYRLGVISNAYPDVQYNKLRGIGLLGYFDAVVLSEECGIRKPDEGIFHRTAEALGCMPASCLYVGDSFETDIIGAKKAGMRACWFNPDGHRESAGATRPDVIISCLPELLDIL